MPKLVRKWREIVMQTQWHLYKYFFLFLNSWISKVYIPYRYDIMKQYIHDNLQCLINVYYVYLAVYMYKLSYTLNFPELWQYIILLANMFYHAIL